MQKCPNCKTEINDLETICPNCGEILFDEPIQVDEVSEELLEETIDDLIEDESIVTKSVVKGWLAFVKLINLIGDKLLLGIQFLGKNIGKYFKRFFTVYMPQFFKKVFIIRSW